MSTVLLAARPALPLCGQHLTKAALGLPYDSLMANDSFNGNDMLTAHPQSVLVGAEVATGHMTIKVSVHSGTPNFSSPTATIVCTDATAHMAEVATSTSNPYVSLQMDETNDAAVTGVKLFAVVLDTLNVTEGESWHDAQTGSSAVESTVTGDGSGVDTYLA